jgi:hypothetical protein
MDIFERSNNDNNSSVGNDDNNLNAKCNGNCKK